MRNSKKEKTPEILVWKNDSPRDYIYSYSAKITNYKGKALYFEGGASSVDEDIAKSKAVYEAIERYSGSRVPKNLKKFVYKNYVQEAIDPNSFIFFASSQYDKSFPYKKPRPDVKIEWVKGLSLTRRKRVYIPAFAVYLGYNQTNPPGGKFFPTASCGLAVHKTFKKAVLHGLFELVERDAAIRLWKNKIKPPRINLSNARSKTLRKLINNIKSEGLEPEVLLSTQNIPIPSVIGLIHNSRPVIPYVTFGLSAGEDIEEVVLKSLEEALMVRASLEYLKREKGTKIFYKTPSQIKTFFDHCLYYSDPEKKGQWQFLLQGPLIEINEIKRAFKITNSKGLLLDKIIETLSSLGHEIFVVDITSDLARLMGLTCVKVIAPRLQQVEINHNYQFLKYNRGRRGFNHFPHPFA
jgi:ribosomal protein S12 methylthiotransferase accessory factor